MKIMCHQAGVGLGGPERHGTGEVRLLRAGMESLGLLMARDPRRATDHEQAEVWNLLPRLGDRLEGHIGALERLDPADEQGDGALTKAKPFPRSLVVAGVEDVV